jgi:hypothetical protein
VRLNINLRNRSLWALTIWAASISWNARADINGDEDETKYEVMVKPKFSAFHKRFGRFPRSWIELGAQSSCTGYDVNEKNHFPKPHEAIIWRPEACLLAYKLVFGTKNSFRVVALANGHVVSMIENYKITYFKTPYHRHEGEDAHDDG